MKIFNFSNYLRFPDEIENKRISYFTHAIILVSISMSSIVSVIKILLPPAINQSDYILWTITGIFVIIYMVYKKGYVHTAGLLYTLTLWLSMTILAWKFGGVRDISVIAYLVIILVSMLISRLWQALLISFLSIASLWVIYYAEYNRIIIPQNDTSFNYSIELTAFILIVIVLMYLTSRSFSASYGRIQKELQEHKLTSEALTIAKEKAQESDRLKTAFMNNISHEVRTPLNGILGFAQFAMKTEITDEEKAYYLNILNSSSERLLNTITDYMDISLIVSGSMTLHKKQVNIPLLMNQLYLKFQSRCKSANLELIEQIPTDSKELYLHCDNNMLEKSLSHLIDNAIKFTPWGRVVFGFRIIDKEFQFFVKDTGSGIDPDVQEKIFDYFRQEEISTTRGYEGSGLGLSITKGMVELMGGKIEIASEKGKGSTFTIFLQAEERITGNSGITKSENSNNEPVNSPLILITDDDEISSYFHKTILKRASYKYLTAKNGMEAIELCRENPSISLVLMDLKMPIMDGLEATQKIKEFRRTLPVIGVSAYAMTGDKERALSAGCDDYITKPISSELLLDIIKKYL
jgi:signal transduction histidine kinase